MGGVIENLGDDDAIRILSLIAKHELGAEDSAEELPAGLNDALEKKFDLSAAAGPVSDGDMARHALLLLALDPEIEQKITTMAENPSPPRKLGPITTLALTAALIAVLKTGVKYKRHPDEKWELEIDSPPLDKDLLKGFVEKLLSWIPKGPFR